MATITWPATLPQDLLVDGFSETFGNNTIRDQFDTGPAGSRPRSTAAARPLSAHLPPITTEQWDIFDSFYGSTLSQGSLPFGFPKPLTDDEWLLRFVSPPVRVPIGGMYWSVKLDLEILP